jgi:hypothetical protein
MQRRVKLLLAMDSTVATGPTFLSCYLCRLRCAPK